MRIVAQNAGDHSWSSYHHNAGGRADALLSEYPVYAALGTTGGLRRSRLFVSGQAQHVIQRGNNRGAIFLEDSDRRFYLDWLGETLADQGCALHAYVLMTNHVHLLTTSDRQQAILKA